MNAHEFVDHDRIARQAEVFKASVDRFVRAAADLAIAKTGHAEAVAQCDRAHAGDPGISPIDAQHCLENAERAVNVATKVHVAAEAFQRKAADGKLKAASLAWAPVYIEGARRRVTAAQKADQARALLAEAEADHKAASDIMRTAHTNGSPHFGNWHQGHNPLLSEAAERQQWITHRVDLETGAHPYDPGEY